MPLPRDHQLRQFLLFAFALILPCFALWTLAAGAIAMPAVGLADMLLQAWFPQTVDALVYRGSDVVLMTQYGELGGSPVPPEQSEYQLAFAINPGILSYSLPFYAPVLATPGQRSLAGLPMALLLLSALILLGLISLCLKELMVAWARCSWNSRRMGANGTLIDCSTS
ncbi:MAG: exosortase H-associated membrane protein [Pseudohongiellaceae bacterium]